MPRREATFWAVMVLISLGLLAWQTEEPRRESKFVLDRPPIQDVRAQPQAPAEPSAELAETAISILELPEKAPEAEASRETVSPAIDLLAPDAGAPKPELKRPPTRVKPPVQPVAKPPQRPQPASPPRETVPEQAGRWPTLDADYSSIGFDAYIDIMGRLGGRFFLYVDGKLGQEVALGDGRVVGRDPDRSLALARPHRVSDASIPLRLRAADLPPNTDPGSVVLLFSTWFDRMVWREVEQAITQHQETAATISLVRAQYLQTSQGYQLVLVDATARRDNRLLPLAWIISLPL